MGTKRRVNPKKRLPIVIWTEVWDEFDAWTETEQEKNKACNTCGHKSYEFPSWEEQKCKIEEIVQWHIDRNI